MVAKKTPLLKPFKVRLADLNDQLCFFLFATEEINQRLSDFSSALNDCYTSDLFAKNTKAQKIHVTLQALPEFKKNNEKLTFGSYFSTSYEVVIGYIDNLLELLSNISPSTFTISSTVRQTPETILASSLNSSNYQPLPNELINTLSYMRLRRNHLTHLNDNMKPNFKNLIMQQGTNLNLFWGLSAQALDFSSLNINNFTENEAIELLKILRLTLEKIDSSVSSSVNTNDIIKHISSACFKPSNINTIKKQERARKVKQIAELDFGLKENFSNILNII